MHINLLCDMTHCTIHLIRSILRAVEVERVVVFNIVTICVVLLNCFSLNSNCCDLKCITHMLMLMKHMTVMYYYCDWMALYIESMIRMSILILLISEYPH